ncbi:MAG: AAA family ATPase [Janthinobacterium lividum]
MLVVIGGLPGVGKTTIGRALAARVGATYLRIDVIEQALRAVGPVGAMGYVVGMALAESNLGIGQTVIADCVNPVRESRRGWRGAAVRVGAGLIEVEVICSDVVEHRRRVEEQRSDIEGLIVPGWQAVVEREYAAWDEKRLVIDTAGHRVEDAVEAILAGMRVSGYGG